MASLKLTVKTDAQASIRLAPNIVHLARNYICKIRIFIDEREYNAKSLLGIAAASIRDGTVLSIEANGPDEDEAVKAMAEFLTGAVTELK